MRNKTPSQISWIGSSQGFLLLFVGFFTGPLLDRGYLQLLIVPGSFLVVFGMMMTSLCREYWQCVLAQGILVGLGCGLLFLPSIAVLPTYFTSKRALALGIAAAGSPIGEFAPDFDTSPIPANHHLSLLGGILYTVIFHRLQPRIGFGWATRVIGFIMLGTQIIPIVGMRLRVKPPRPRRIFDASAFKERTFLSFTLTIFLENLGLYIPFFYVQIYAITKGIVDENLGFYLLAILHTGSFVGRIVRHPTVSLFVNSNVSLSLLHRH